MSLAKKIKIYISIFCISFIQVSQYTVSPVLSRIKEHYSDVNVSLVQMLITAPSLLAMVIALISGWLVVRISKKKLLLFAAMITGLTGMVPLLADSFGIWLFSRIIFGIALGLATALNTVVVADFFEGEERVSAMGVQAASIGIGMLVVTTISGIIGSSNFLYVNFFQIFVGITAMILLALFLPDTDKIQAAESKKIKLNGTVFCISFLGGLEFLFLISFTTNISMHLRGPLTGNTSAAGILSGIFSGAQVVMGLTLRFITRIIKKYTLPVAMLSFAFGTFILILFPSKILMLMIGAVFCGFSQGMFIPQAMCDISNAVDPLSTAMASACFTCAMCIGQLISPGVLNMLSYMIFHEITTTHVYMVSAVCMTIIGTFVIIFKGRSKNNT